MRAKFITCLAISVGLHLLCLTPLFFLPGSVPQPQAETIDVKLVEAKPHLIHERKPDKPTEITKAEKITPIRRAPTQPQPSPPQLETADTTPPPEGISFETEGKINVGYMQRLKTKIFRVWQYPPAAIAAGHQGWVKIAFVVDEEGRLIGVELLTGSGYRELDRAVMEAVRDASPFGRFTPDIQQETLKIKGRFRYVID
jgi:periplasmic protein TonB